MEVVFYIAAIVAITSTILAITRLNAVHALLYLIVSLLSVAVVFFVMGAPFIAALEVIVYAGAILAAILIAEIVWLVSGPGNAVYGSTAIEPKQVGIVLFGPYLIGVELASMLLLGALVGAYHLGRRAPAT